MAQIAAVGRLTSRQLAEKQRRNKRIRPDDVTYLREATGDRIIYSPYQQRVEDIKGGSEVYEAGNLMNLVYAAGNSRCAGSRRPLLQRQ